MCVCVCVCVCAELTRVALRPVAVARKDGRYREPPPTPPGYTALTAADLPDGPPPAAPSAPVATTTAGPLCSRRPPDYSTALQRSRMVTQSPDLQHRPPRGPPHGPAHGPPRPEEEEEGES